MYFEDQTDFCCVEDSRKFFRTEKISKMAREMINRQLNLAKMELPAVNSPNWRKLVQETAPGECITLYRFIWIYDGEVVNGVETFRLIRMS